MEKDFWDERFASDEFVYGTEPNEFFRNELSRLVPGKLLLPGEGEGRNAVFAAKNGWNVTAVDFSSNAKLKAEKFALQNNVKLNYLVSSIREFAFPENEYDAIGIIFVHLPENIRGEIHQKLIKALKKDGTIILEAFSKEQIRNNSGGPRELSMLYSVNDLKLDFADLVVEKLSEDVITLNEGQLHSGIANVIRLKARKI